MSRQFVVNLDLDQNQLLNALLQVLATDPGSPAQGQFWFRSDQGEVRYYDGSTVRKLAELVGSGAAAITYNGDGTVTVGVSKAAVDALGIDADQLDGQDGTHYLARANHTGTQTASTISDFDTQVRTSRLDQMAAPTSDVDLNSQKITDLADPTSAQDAATKAYVDAASQGLDVKGSARAATTGNITLSGEQTIDGVSLSSGDRVLVKDQSTGSENGIYVVASGSWSRADDADDNDEVTAGMFVFVEEGTSHADSGWVLTTNDPITVGSTSLAFAQFSGAGQITAGDGLTKTGNTLDVGGTADRITVSGSAVDIASTYVGQASITTLGTIATGTWEADDIGIAHGGTGASSASDARSNLGLGTAATHDVPASGDAAAGEVVLGDDSRLGGGLERHAETIGDGSSSSIQVTHSLGSEDVLVQVREVSTDEVVIADITIDDTNNVTIGFASAPASNSIRVVVIG